MNIPLLKKVATKLRRLRHKEHFYMPQFIKKTECGTAACIGGHGLLLEGYKPVYSHNTAIALFVLTPTGRQANTRIAARRLFGLSREQATRLFDQDYWPYGFDPSDPKSAAARIDRFIQTKGRE